MGLYSALTTSLTGLSAAETSIDVAGNNVANANTVGFKESKVSFATQFLQTQSIGSAPSSNLGGTNPRQIGLGVKVAEISPEYTQGTIQISSNPLDLAIQGDGFFMVQGPAGDTLYTRNGQFRTNAANEVVTASGYRLIGYGRDDDYNVDRSSLGPIKIPLGDAAVAEATENVFLVGALNPNSTKGTIPAIIQSAVLSDGTKEVPSNATTAASVGRPPDTTTAALSSTAGTLTSGGSYTYRVTFLDSQGNETPASTLTTAVTVGAGASLDLTGLPAIPSGYASARVYRNNSVANNEYRLVTTYASAPATYNDGATDASIAAATQLSDTGLASGTYTYYVTFAKSGGGAGTESRPAAKIGPVTVDGSTSPRVLLSSIPSPTSPDYDEIRIYRSLQNAPNEWHLVDTLAPGTTRYIDSSPDASIASAAEVNLEGPPINVGLLLTDVVSRNGSVYSNLFEEGTLDFTPTKDGRALGTKSLDITATTTVGDLLTFMNQSMGIVLSDTQDSFPDGGYTFGGTTYALGATLVDGRIAVQSNMGQANALSIGLSGFKLTPDGSTTSTAVSLPFTSVYGADNPVNGEGATTDFVVYDSLGSPINVRLTTVLEERTSTEARFRWIAVSDGNEEEGNVETVVGTGLIVTDVNGRFDSSSNDIVGINRIGAESPLEFQLDFNQVTGLDAGDNEIQMSRQDGFPAGTLSSFIITESGLIQGVFTNGSTRDLGQLQMAKFANPAGLEQRGDNLYAKGVNSGDAIVDDPGQSGIGSITAGAVELSNTDIGQNLIELILASTQYRGSARVITAAQQLLDELLNLRR